MQGKISILTESEQVDLQRKAMESEITLAEKIASVVESENVTVDIAERALRRARTIVRTQAVVTFTHQ